MTLTRTQQRLLKLLASGHSLKSHRYLDGTKVFILHALDGETESVEQQDVIALVSHGYVTSNQKFPAATYMMTDSGRSAAALDSHEMD